MKNARRFSRTFAASVAICAAFASVYGASLAMAADGSTVKASVVYFSRAENAGPLADRLVDGISSASVAAADKDEGATAVLARYLGEALGTTPVSIRTMRPYPAGFQETISVNHDEYAASALPAIKATALPSDADIVFIGYPNWAMHLPRAIASFAMQNDLTGKTVALFNTNDGYGPGRGVDEVKAIAPKARVLDDVFAVRGTEAADAKEAVVAWAKEKVDLLESKTDAAVSAGQTITCTTGGRTIRISLNDSPEAKQFAKMLPVTVQMVEFGGREFYGPLDGEISAEGKGQYNFEDGTLTYCPTNNTVAIFYAQSSRPNLTMAVYPMGKVTSDLSVFHELSSNETFRFEAR